MHTDPKPTISPRTRIGLAALALGGALACDVTVDLTDIEDWTFPDWDKVDALADGPNPTTDATVEVLRGYNVVTDVSLGVECVAPEQERYRAGATKWSETLSVIETIEELHETLQVDAKAQVKAGPLDIEGSTQFSQSFKSSDTSLNLLLRANASYGVVNLDPVNLTDEALALAKRSPSDFTRQCGTHYLAGVNYGAELRVLITVETSSFEERESLKAKLAVEGIKAGPTTVGGEVKTEVSKLLTKSATSITAKAEAFGFSTDHSLAALEGNPLDSASDLVESISKDLGESVANDQCNDGGCNDASGGYKNNTHRSAVPVGVLKRTYRSAGNFPRDDASLDAFIAHDDTIAGALALVEEHARVYTTVSTIYADEVSAQLESAQPYDFAMYRRREFAESAASESLLRERANAMADVFDPEGGKAITAIGDSLSPCWDRAVQGDFSTCTSAQLGPAYAMIEDYAERRIRRVYYTVAAENEEFDDLVCAKNSRLPDRFEASRLYAAVRNNPTIPAPDFTEEFFGNENYGIWVDPKGECPQDHGMWVQFSTSTMDYGCYENKLATIDIELPVLCVPESGPFGPSVQEL